ncbi:MAG: glutamate--tRNA ligase [Spirochaetaceae bacterium]|jgi:glutamyl-tRNA synthetase|nr:glutamate--tRNA ligase [Spirochaetaceae bacterium]
MKTRVRYAPSPTGLQHIGGIRTALFNCLYARATGGTFALRLEDTDRTRCDDAFVKNLYDTFDWLGFRWDEGPDVGGAFAPYVQSERSALYQRYARELLDKGAAYRCFCSGERLEAVRKEREAAKSPLTGYDRQCRSLKAEEAEARANAGESHTIRLKIPLGERTVFHDALLGDVEWKNDDVNPDPVLLKSDGFPTYHLANIVDDHLMEITHVLRAQEWLSSTPLHIILYRVFGWEPPVFCHLPMVMGQDGKKLSKRHGATSIDEFRKGGYLPDALLNYVALLGASYEEGREIWTLDDLAKRFSLDKINKAPAVFDYRKLAWFNAEYIKAAGNEELAVRALPFALDAGLFGGAGRPPDSGQKALFVNAMPLVKERAALLTEIPAKLAYLFAAPPVPDKQEFIPKKGSIEDARVSLERALPLVAALATGDDAGAEVLVKAACEKSAVKIGDFLMPLRVAITGSRVSPPLFGSMRLLGADECAARIKRALESC